MHLLFLRAISASSLAFCSSKPCFTRRVSRQFSSFRKMNRGGYRGGYSRGRGSYPIGESKHRHEDVGPSIAASSGSENVSSHGRKTSSKWAGGSTLKQSNCSPAVVSPYQQDGPSSGSKDGHSHVDIRQHGQTSLGSAFNTSSIHPEWSSLVDPAYGQDEPSLYVRSSSTGSPHIGKPQHRRTSPQKAAGNNSSEQSECLPNSFDICQIKKGTPVTLKAPLLIKNRENRKEIKRSKEDPRQCVLRPGMVLLKKYISHSDQIKIIKKCRNLGLGPGGFYQPGYRDGAKLHLQMMCLGQIWDPETRQYGDHRSIDGAEAPIIPEEFKQLVKGAIKASHDLIKQESQVSNVEDVLPGMAPDICIVNFYTNSGRLGLHQDRDESTESLAKGLPVVSFSLGDTANFLYGVDRDVDKAEKVSLESGDVLIFGGESRRIYHGVPSIVPNTAPRFVVEEANLRPGRLNLTFREY
ncbi:hypothetical protein HHK36_010622 [Tetracentron sinense]|uniref:DNA N(6)-methyladenine demethylase n=1 Tax=Tetracentron sinense TaxID=13715 RepID=A0A834Z9X8_TETSI|nr:hypothetical protein HHK36_010622 [Tetracentron sinense]